VRAAPFVGDPVDHRPDNDRAITSNDQHAIRTSWVTYDMPPGDYSGVHTSGQPEQQ